MSSLTLGASPVGLTMWLIDAAPFAASVTATVPFPSPPELLFSDGTTWPGTLDDEGTTAAWVRTAAEVAALVESSPRRATLRDPDSHHVWAHGTVYVTRVNESGTSDALPPGGSITVDNLDGALHITYVVGSGGGGAVDSVNGQTGAVVLDASDVGALPDTTPIPATPGDIGAQPAGDYATTTALTEGLSGKADAAHTHTPASIGAATAGQGGLADSAVQPGDDAATLGSGSATSGRVLTADGSGGAAWEAASGGGFPGPPIPPVHGWLSPAAVEYSSTQGGPWPAGGTVALSPIEVGRPMTVNSLVLRVNTGEAGIQGRALLYGSTVDGLPGGLIAHATFDASTGGYKEIGLASPVALSAGWYWVAIMSDGGSAVRFYAVKPLPRLVVGAPWITSPVMVAADLGTFATPVATVGAIAGLPDTWAPHVQLKRSA